MRYILALLLAATLLTAQSPAQSLNHSLHACIRPTFTIGPKFYILNEPYERPVAVSMGYSLGYSFMDKDEVIIITLALDVNTVSFPDGDEYSIGHEWDEYHNLIPVHEHWLQSERQVSYPSISASMGFPFGEMSPFYLYFTLGVGRINKSYHSEYSELYLVGETAEEDMWAFEPPEYYDGNGYWDVRNLAVASGGGCSWILKNHLVASLDFRIFSGMEKNEPLGPSYIAYGDYPEYISKAYGFLFSLSLTYHLPLP